MLCVYTFKTGILIGKLKNNEHRKAKLSGFIDLLFEDEGRIAENEFIKKVTSNENLSWILCKDKIKQRVCYFDEYFLEQQNDDTESQGGLPSNLQFNQLLQRKQLGEKQSMRSWRREAIQRRAVGVGGVVVACSAAGHCFK